MSLMDRLSQLFAQRDPRPADPDKELAAHWSESLTRRAEDLERRVEVLRAERRLIRYQRRRAERQQQSEGSSP